MLTLNINKTSSPFTWPNALSCCHAIGRLKIPLTKRLNMLPNKVAHWVVFAMNVWFSQSSNSPVHCHLWRRQKLLPCWSNLFHLDCHRVQEFPRHVSHLMFLPDGILLSVWLIYCVGWLVFCNKAVNFDPVPRLHKCSSSVCTQRIVQQSWSFKVYWSTAKPQSIIDFH